MVSDFSTQTATHLQVVWILTRPKWHMVVPLNLMTLLEILLLGERFCLCYPKHCYGQAHCQQLSHNISLMLFWFVMKQARLFETCWFPQQKGARCIGEHPRLRTIICCRWWLNQMNLFYEIRWLAANHSPKAFWKSVKLVCVTGGMGYERHEEQLASWGTGLWESDLKVWSIGWLGLKEFAIRKTLKKSHDKVLKEPLVVENFENHFFGFPWLVFLSTVQSINQATNETCPVVRQALSLYGSDLFLARQPRYQWFQRIFIASCDEWLRWPETTS